MKTNKRYARQIVLPEIGEFGQSRITSASVLCVGSGGLGSPALLYLAAAGVGDIGVIDFDDVEVTNLQRQTLFTINQIGQNKAKAAQERLQRLNPDVNITAYAEELTAENAQALFEQYDLVIDGTDNFAAKFLINDAAVKAAKPFIYGSILGFEGQVSTFNLNNGPCYRCLFPEAPKGHIPNCAEAGVIGALAGMIGTMQAMEAIKIIVGHESFETLSGKIWTVDARSMRTQSLSLEKDPNCPVCSQPSGNIKLRYSSRASSKVTELSVQDAQSKKDALFIDVREIEEWDAGHMSSAKHFALSDIMRGHPTDWPKDREIILYCQKGMRSRQAAQILQDRGYSNVNSMVGGFEAWLESA